MSVCCFFPSFLHPFISILPPTLSICCFHIQNLIFSIYLKHLFLSSPLQKWAPAPVPFPSKSSPPPVLQDICGGNRLLQPVLPHDVSGGTVLSQETGGLPLHHPHRRYCRVLCECTFACKHSWNTSYCCNSQRSCWFFTGSSKEMRCRYHPAGAPAEPLYQLNFIYLTMNVVKWRLLKWTCDQTRRSGSDLSRDGNMCGPPRTAYVGFIAVAFRGSTFSRFVSLMLRHKPFFSTLSLICFEHNSK